MISYICSSRNFNIKSFRFLFRDSYAGFLLYDVREADTTLTLIILFFYFRSSLSTSFDMTKQLVTFQMENSDTRHLVVIVDELFQGK